jgi:hypothetical protein
MSKKRIIGFAFIPTLCVAGILIWGLIVASRPIEFRSSEEPFATLRQPFRNVRAGYVMDGGSVVLRIVDATGREEFLFAQWNHATKSRDAVIRRNLNQPSKPSDWLTDAEAAKSDMTAILRRHRNELDEDSQLAYKALMMDSGALGGVCRTIENLW